MTSRNKSHWFACYADDWVGGTRAMSIAAKGAYFELLVYQFANGAVPMDDAKICRIAGASMEEWETVRDEVLSKFDDDGNGGWVNARMASESLERESIRQKRIAAGSKGGAKGQASGKQKAKQNGSTCSSKTGAHGQASTTTTTGTQRESTAPEAESIVSLWPNQQGRNEALGIVAGYLETEDAGPIRDGTEAIAGEVRRRGKTANKFLPTAASFFKNQGFLSTVEQFCARWDEDEAKRKPAPRNAAESFRARTGRDPMDASDWLEPMGGKG